MISEKCTEIGNINRKRYDIGARKFEEPFGFLPYPEGCQCACRHEYPVQWEKSYNCKPPWLIKVQETDVL